MSKEIFVFGHLSVDHHNKVSKHFKVNGLNRKWKTKILEWDFAGAILFFPIFFSFPLLPHDFAFSLKSTIIQSQSRTLNLITWLLTIMCLFRQELETKQNRNNLNGI